MRRACSALREAWRAHDGADGRISAKGKEEECHKSKLARTQRVPVMQTGSRQSAGSSVAITAADADELRHIYTVAEFKVLNESWAMPCEVRKLDYDRFPSDFFLFAVPWFAHGHSYAHTSLAPCAHP